MLTVSNVSKRLGDQLVLDRISFTVNHGDRIGLAGPNGAGKSTLLAIMSKRLPADTGSVSMPPSTTIGFLRQGFADLQGGTLGMMLDEQLRGLLSAGEGLTLATEDLSNPAIEQSASLARFADATEQFEDLGGYATVNELTLLLGKFGLDRVPFDTPLHELSGGEKTRAGLAAILAARPDLLLLDEPTNHLDLDALLWLEEFVRSYRGAIVIVSHDRVFIDKTASQILELSDESRSVTAYPGNYSAYIAAKQRAAEAQLDAFERQQREIQRIERDIRAVASHGQKTEGETTNDYIRGRAKKVARTAKVRERRLERVLDSSDRIEKPGKRWGLALELDAVKPSGRDVIIADRVILRFGERTILSGIDLHIRAGERVALVGPNGAGKSTLLRVLSGRMAPESGTVRLGAAVELGIYDQEQENVDLGRSALDQVRSASSGEESEIRTFLHRFLFTEDQVRRPAGELSYGERARLSLALLVRRGANVLLLDEPLNHLDLDARERFEDALLDFDGAVVIVLHDRYAIERLATRVIELRDGKLNER